MVMTPAPASPRHKSFAQHLLEIEQEAAKAASRCRWAHSKTALAFDQPPQAWPVEPPSPGATGGQPTDANAAALGSARRAAGAAERERDRSMCEVRILRRTLPELEEAVSARESLLQASLSQQQALARGRMQQDTKLQELQASLQQALAECAGLRDKASKQARLMQQQERDIARLEAQLAAASAGGSPGGAPGTPGTPFTPTGRRAAAGAPPPLTPPSALLEGIDEDTTPRSRGAAYWRRAQMSFRIASIADYWQAAAKEGADGRGSTEAAYRPAGTPWPGHKMQARRAAKEASLSPGGPPPGTPGSPQGAAGSAQGAAQGAAEEALLRAAGKKLDEAVRLAVASALLELELAVLDGGARVTAARQEEAARKAAEEAAQTLELPVNVASNAGEAAKQAALRGWAEKTASWRAAACSGAKLRAASTQGQAAAAAVIAATKVVIEKNMPPLEEHLRTIVHDNCAAAVRQLRGAKAATRAAAAEKAPAVTAALAAAIDNVTLQFTSGLRATVPSAVATQVGSVQVQRLCAQAVASRCKKLRAAHPEADIAARLWEEVSMSAKLQQQLASSGDSLQTFLSDLLKGAAKLQLPAHLLDFVASRVASHLDPYVDGDVTTPADEASRGTSPMLPWLQRLYKEQHGRPLPVPAEVVLTQYVVHGIARANATHCFGDLMMGQGRLPVAPYEQDAHFVALGRALRGAILKDFGAEASTIQGAQVTETIIEELAREHSRLLYLQQQVMGNALADANRLGEVGRKDEMKRIFGIDM